MNKFIINSSSSGNFHIEKTGGRDFLVTEMLAIESETVMNGIYYPHSAVANSYTQLDAIPAPAGHPFFNGQPVSALDPQGAAPFNIGAFVRRPLLNKNAVTTELVLDIEVAKQSPRGQEVLSRIKNRKKIGVSTGGTGNVTAKTGKKDGKQYTRIANTLYFDHVAVLLDEIPAGANTYTLNSEQYFTHQNQQKGNEIMREITIDTSTLSLADHKFLELQSGDASVFVNALKNEVTPSEAQEIIENSGKAVVTQRDFEEFQNSSEDFKAFKAEKAAERDEKIAFVITNSKMSEEGIKELSETALNSLVNSIAPNQKHISNGKIIKPVLTALEGA